MGDLYIIFSKYSILTVLQKNDVLVLKPENTRIKKCHYACCFDAIFGLFFGQS